MSALPPTRMLCARLAELLGAPAEEIAPDANLVVLGLSSLNVMRLHSALRRAGVTLDFDEMIATPTLAAWIRQVDTAPTRGTDQ